MIRFTSCVRFSKSFLCKPLEETPQTSYFLVPSSSSYIPLFPLTPGKSCQSWQAEIQGLKDNLAFYVARCLAQSIAYWDVNGNVGIDWGSIGRMEKKMEATTLR